MEIIKTPNEIDSYYDFKIRDKEKVLNIFFAGNLDLYMMLGNGEIIPDNKNVALSFNITKDNLEIYELFRKLYKNIINGNISNEHNYKDSLEYKKLVDDNKNITWISDDGPIDSEDILVISLVDEIINLKFIRRSKLMEFKMKNPMAISIRIRNARSKYKPFNTIFMDLYNDLQQIDNNKILKK